MPGLLDGKVGLVAGLSNKYGVAWGVTQALLREGARLAFTHQERYTRQAEELTAEIPDALRVPTPPSHDPYLSTQTFTKSTELLVPS